MLNLHTSRNFSAPVKFGTSLALDSTEVSDADAKALAEEIVKSWAFDDTTPNARITSRMHGPVARTLSSLGLTDGQRGLLWYPANQEAHLLLMIAIKVGEG